MSNKSDVQFEAGGRVHNFDQASTEVHIYLDEPIFNHVKTTEYGSQVLRLFNDPDAISFLAGIPTPDDELFDEGVDISGTMEADYGWNAKLFIDQKAPDNVKERYIGQAMGRLPEVIHVPEEWVSV